IGPGAGEHGGSIVADGTPQDVMDNPKSLTGKYLSGEEFLPVPAKRRKASRRKIGIVEASENNLKGISVKIPIGLMTVVTGVSGSGKSTLVNEILYKAMARNLYKGKHKPGKHKKINGLKYVEKVINIDQS